MRRWRMLAVAIAFVSVWSAMAAGITAVGLTEELRVLALVMLPTVVVASLLVLYFEWRGKLRRRILAEPDGRLDLDDAA